MLNTRTITHLITATIVASGIAYFSPGIAWAKDDGNRPNYPQTVSAPIISQRHQPHKASHSNENTVTPTVFTPPHPLPDAWVKTEGSEEKSDGDSTK